MARTVIEEREAPTTTSYVEEEESRPIVGLMIGLVAALLVIVMAIVFARITYNANTRHEPTPPGNGNASVPANPNPQPTLP